jgi:rhomboid protease GluP
MTSHRSGRGFFEIPHAAVYLLLTANIVIAGLCLSQSGATTAPSPLLYRYGAMYSFALQRHEYWRLFAYGFLHVNIVHLVTNMLCLALWGGHLEKRVGALYFLVIYACALVFGAIVGDASHAAPPYLTVGASGATSGILGALLCLWILGKIDLQANFFAINIGLNIALALSNSRIDWGVHLGGFAAGLIACALLDLIEKINARLLRCKFPEFVKANLFGLACACGLLLWSNAPAVPMGAEWWASAGSFIAICGLGIKVVDIILSLKMGLAMIVVLLAIANAAMFVAGYALSGSYLLSACTPGLFAGRDPIEGLIATACANPVMTTGLTAGLALLLTLFLYSEELHRGVGDVGFVGTSLRAERRRRQGI